MNSFSDPLLIPIVEVLEKALINPQLEGLKNLPTPSEDRSNKAIWAFFRAKIRQRPFSSRSSAFLSDIEV